MVELERCRWCHELVRWAKTTKDKPMALNPDPDVAGNVVYTIADQETSPVRVLTKDELEGPADQVRYKPHFATCPYSRHARKGATPAARARTRELFDQETSEMEKPKRDDTEERMNLLEGILAECNRVRELLPAYEEIGPVGAFGLAVLQAAIKEGEAALGSGDVVRMLRAHQALKDCQ